MQELTGRHIEHERFELIRANRQRLRAIVEPQRVEPGKPHAKPPHYEGAQRHAWQEGDIRKAGELVSS
jgi:hypothetical protein